MGTFKDFLSFFRSFKLIKKNTSISHDYLSEFYLFFWIRLVKTSMTMGFVNKNALLWGGIILLPTPGKVILMANTHMEQRVSKIAQVTKFEFYHNISIFKRNWNLRNSLQFRFIVCNLFTYNFWDDFVIVWHAFLGYCCNYKPIICFWILFF